MRVTVLGRWGGFPPAGGACSGYLVEEDGRRILLDCGHGVVSRLLQRVDVYSLHGLILTHLHPDHVADVPALRLALEWSCYPPERWEGRLPAFGPTDAERYLSYTMQSERGLRVFDLRRILPGEEVAFCGFRVRFTRTQHPVETYAVRLEGPGGVLAYTADTTFHEEVVALCRGADLLVAECTFPDGMEEVAWEVGHLTPRLAGELAASARVRRLLLSHFFPTVDPEQMANAARAVFPRTVCAEELGTYEVGQGAS
ncbi:MAG: MBL fold metallo-hydrolase [Armatimonadota bacterium]|nr:MBL fold metallo-hydrolase [Armatimonadota bacterium]MDR7438567.1 MBL fold metallo-hydrolase [Armatimonadota bacterium]MDR7567091.1 MBL fold metallo-hydrolase [Armatimonadota bacterium]MDR7602728.1 MBL fold metallo-hydrolase [Armatimonadota bacterium]